MLGVGRVEPPLSTELMSAQADGSYLSIAANHATLYGQFQQAVIVQQNRPADRQFNVGTKIESLVSRKCKPITAYIRGSATSTRLGHTLSQNSISEREIEGIALL